MIREVSERVRIVLKRRDAYRSLFLSGFNGTLGPQAEIVLADLRRACCVDRSALVFDNTGRVDPIASARNEGRREIWIRIQQCLHLDDETIHKMLDASEA